MLGISFIPFLGLKKWEIINRSDIVYPLFLSLIFKIMLNKIHSLKTILPIMSILGFFEFLCKGPMNDQTKKKRKKEKESIKCMEVEKIFKNLIGLIWQILVKLSAMWTHRVAGRMWKRQQNNWFEITDASWECSKGHIFSLRLPFPLSFQLWPNTLDTIPNRFIMIGYLQLGAKILCCGV